MRGGRLETVKVKWGKISGIFMSRILVSDATLLVHSFGE